VGTQHCSYSYNALNQLIAESGVASNDYLYDSRHNRLFKNSGSYTVCSLDALHTAENRVYQHDLLGNPLQFSEGVKTVSYSYDALGRLIAFEELAKHKITYEYDGFNRRIAAITYQWDTASNGWQSQGKKRFLYHGESEIGAVDDSGNFIELRVIGKGRGPGIGATVAIELAGKVYAPHHDYVGSIAAVVDTATEQVVESYLYTAFGEEEIYDVSGGKIGNSRLGNSWRYASKRVDEITQLVQFWLRDYDPVIGRWLTPDPAGHVDGLNLYAYVGNRPLMYMDLYGLYKVNPELHSYYSEASKLAEGVSAKELNTIVNYASRDLGKKQVDIEGIPLARGRISFGNGIFNALQEHTESARMLSDLSGGYAVRGVYNDSRGPGVIKAVLESFGYKTTEVMNLRTEFCRSFLDFAKLRANGENVSHLHLSHSQGGIQAKHALTVLPKAVQQHIQILNINGAKTVPAKYCGFVKNIQSKRDIVPRFDIGGQIQYRNQIEFVSPHPEAPIIDHTLLSPTMQEPILRNLKMFTNKYR
jgi:RHS repeat-associated protein